MTCAVLVVLGATLLLPGGVAAPVAGLAALIAAAVLVGLLRTGDSIRLILYSRRSSSGSRCSWADMTEPAAATGGKGVSGGHAAGVHARESVRWRSSYPAIPSPSGAGRDRLSR